MAIVIGQQLGSYEITALLGKGGMGEVYRARDLRLKREVAIKILPEEFSSDADRVTRFQREAEVLASLNHPNIASIYDFEESNGWRYLVLELVEGETLAHRIARGPVPIEEAMHIAIQICEALEAAHERGIIHRDLKPANVKLTPDGKVKVLDFGLAKAMERKPVSGTLSNSPTLSLAATQAGMILGTAAYMSPEQAKGFEVDARSDTFSFGSVLYEMLSGRQAFQGDTVAEILASVLVREADFSLLPPNLNPRLLELLQRCLEKNPKRRWQAVGDLRAELEIIAAAPRATLTATSSAAVAPQRPLWKRAIPIVLTAIVFSALAAIAAWRLKPEPSASVGRFSVVLPERQNFTRTRSQVLAISPDGSTLVYVANRQLYLRRISELEAQPIPGTQEDVGSPFFSPDGRSIGFYSFQDQAIKKIAITGGAAVTLCLRCTNTLAYGMSWQSDKIAFERGGGEILVMPQTGGNPAVWVKAEENERISSPQILPDGDSLMFASLKAGTRWDKADIVVLSRKSGERKIVLQGGSGARYLDTGHLIYSIGANLFAIPFDIRQLKVTGDPISVVQNVMRSVAFDDGPANFDVSRSGTLVYAVGSPDNDDGVRAVAMTDKTGRTNLLSGLPSGSYSTPRVSPDGKYLALENTSDGSIGIFELSGQSQLRRLTLLGVNANATWSPDGTRIAFRSNRDGKIGIFTKNFDGTGNDEPFTTANAGQEYPFAWSPDKNYIVFVRDNRLWSLALNGERKVMALSEGDQAAFNASFSPDGRWLAFAANGSRPPGLRIFVQQFPSGAKYQVSRELGNAPVWSRDGQQLFYYQIETRKLVSVRVQTQPSFSVSEPVVIPIDVMIQADGGIRQFDVLPDGRVVALRPAPLEGRIEQRQDQRINVVLHWFEELHQR